MKRTFFLLLLASLFLIKCNNDDNGDDGPTDPLNELPAATQTGAQTLGCLINGEPFIPSNFGNSAPNAFYQFVDGAYTLSISASSGGGDSLTSIRIQSIDNPILIESGNAYPLLNCDIPNYCGEYFSFADELIANSNSNFPGELIITRFDESIISGTFGFTVLDNDGNEITITDGRFDLNYTN